MAPTYRYFKITIPSDVKTGHAAVDNIKAVLRPSPKKKAAMIVLHGFTMRKEHFLPYGEALSELGVSSLHLDLPYHGERALYGDVYVPLEMGADEIKQALEQALADIKKSVTILEKLGYEKIGIAGYSLGAICALLAMGADNRLKSGIAICGGGDIAGIIMESPIAAHLATGLRDRNTSPDDLRHRLANVEPLNYAQNIDPHRLLMINGTRDTIVPPKYTHAILDSLRGSPHIYWQDCDHFSPRFQTRARDHLEDFLKN